jgi:regulatory protein
VSPRKIRRSARRSDGSRQAADTVALRLLARRPRTRRELADELAERGHGAVVIESVLESLAADGRLDDRELALHFILVRTDRLGHGQQRLLRELEARGVDRDVAAAAWRAAVEDYGVDPDHLLARQLQRQLRRSGERLGPAAYRRVYNALLRAGFGSHDVRRELQRYRAFDDASGDGGDEADDDLR